MNWKKSLVVAVLLSSLFVVSWVAGPAVLNGSRLFLFGNVTSSSSSSTMVQVDPAKVVSESLQSGSTFTVDVNVSAVTDLFAWQINMTWNPDILNVNNIIAGTFLYQTTSANKTSSASSYFGGLGFVINATNNVAGHVGMAESILEDVLPGEVSGVSGEGVLVTIEFVVVDYGWTELSILKTGNLATTLLNSTVLPDGKPGTITFEKTDGWFDNRLPGDANSDKRVSVADWGVMSDHWTSPPGPLPYARYCDMNDDGRISVADWGIASDNWGRTIP